MTDQYAQPARDGEIAAYSRPEGDLTGDLIGDLTFGELADSLERSVSVALSCA
eukprot:CAMPEP_0181208314 /NCGR_PEP_ID=MMETSP1096-20121128/22053_1 /TAXON_ID=156174 ORGANISM="Chrysochromulina ericina, Strain CCMP281" /NCGR_SAMPLE_ID=MMETSP1096 /ASSEMBLY_ACC=CAM_ASM_000453 /LENGTH=52 /DNA_ID=CAMNT_0023299373 /DNA_START=277 /DNA_END=435 /DNA_ORIENTATION=-